MDELQEPRHKALGEAQLTIQTFRECIVTLSKIIIRADAMLTRNQISQAHTVLSGMRQVCTDAVAKYETAQVMERAGGSA